MDRIIDEGELGDKIYYLVKWKSLSYDDCTWEPRELVLDVNIKYKIDKCIFEFKF